MYFKEGRERAGAPYLTEMMREVRAIVQRAGAAKGRELTLLARVLPTEEQCLAIGMDVRTWAAEGLVDVLAPATRGYLNMTPDVSGMVALGHEHGCQVYGGTSDLWVPYYTAYPDKDGKRNPRASVPMFRAAAAKLWHAGVDAIHVFNYDCHCTGIQHHAVEEHIGLDDVPLFNPDEYRILTEIGDREGIARKDKHYVVAHDVDRRSGGAGRAPAGRSGRARSGRGDRADRRRRPGRSQERRGARRRGPQDHPGRLPGRQRPAARGAQRPAVGMRGERPAARLC